MPPEKKEKNKVEHSFDKAQDRPEQDNPASAKDSYGEAKPADAEKSYGVAKGEMKTQDAGGGRTMSNAGNVVVISEDMTPKPSQRELWQRFLDKLPGRKAKRLGKIMSMFDTRGGVTISNDDVEKLLRVSDSTATRYLDELVRQGKLIRSGSTSGSVYRLPVGSNTGI